MFRRIVQDLRSMLPVHEPSEEESQAFKAGYRKAYPAECDPALSSDASIDPGNRHYKRGCRAGAETYRLVKENSPHLFTSDGQLRNDPEEPWQK